jgi:hypothetical protein
MDASEPHVRRRGLFGDLDTGDPDTGDFEATEGIRIRAGFARPRGHRSIASAANRRPTSAVRSTSSEPVSSARHTAVSLRPPLKSTSVTDTHQQARMPH